MPWRAENFALKLYIKALCLSKSAVTQAVSSISFFWFCGIRFDKISEFLDTKQTKIIYKEHATKNGYLIRSIRGPKMPKNGRMRQSDIFQTPHPWMRLCLIQKVKLFLITGLTHFVSVKTLSKCFVWTSPTPGFWFPLTKRWKICVTKSIFYLFILGV